jgi:hypothetical protein
MEPLSLLSCPLETVSLRRHSLKFVLNLPDILGTAVTPCGVWTAVAGTSHVPGYLERGL